FLKCTGCVVLPGSLHGGSNHHFRCVNGAAFGKDDCPFYGVLQLPDIPRPMITLEALHHALVYFHAQAFIFLSVNIQEMVDQEWDVIGPFSQWWYANLDRV